MGCVGIYRLYTGRSDFRVSGGRGPLVPGFAETTPSEEYRESELLFLVLLPFPGTTPPTLGLPRPRSGTADLIVCCANGLHAILSMLV